METVGKLLVSLLPVGCSVEPHLTANLQRGSCAPRQDSTNAEVVRVADSWCSEARVRIGDVRDIGMVYKRRGGRGDSGGFGNNLM